MELMSGKGSTEGAAFEPLLPAARRPFSIKAVRIGETAYPVSERELITLPWGTLTAFSHAGALHRQVLVVAPLSGGFPFLLRDLVIGLLRHAHQVAITAGRMRASFLLPTASSASVTASATSSA